MVTGIKTDSKLNGMEKTIQKKKNNPPMYGPQYISVPLSTSTQSPAFSF